MKVLLQWLGLDNGSSLGYLFWSGFGSDLTEFAIIGVVYKHFKCQSCYRIGKHKVEGTNYKTCHKHLTVEDHKRLQVEYKKKHPRQHEITNK